MPSGSQSPGPVVLIFRTILAVNLVRFLLSFLPGFEGDEETVGLADKLFGGFRLGSFRVDFVWICVLTFVVFIALFFFIPDFRKDPAARVNTYLSVAWIATFFLYIAKVLFTGLLDFG